MHKYVLEEHDIVELIVRRRLDEHDWNYRFVMDGFPQNASQAQFFRESYGIDAVILIDVPEQVVTDRVLSRRLWSGCGLDYNLISHWPTSENECDACNGQLVSRPDDTSVALADRLRDYLAKTEPLTRQSDLLAKSFPANRFLQLNLDDMPPTRPK